MRLPPVVFGGILGTSKEGAKGKLVICPTPIGNLGDMTQRALDALESADVVCAEDTRVTGKLLSAYGISKRLERLDEAMIGGRSAAIVDRVLAGQVVAYCSDAGMPGVSDPGLRLVDAALEAGAPVEVLPGATAAATAYVASGFANPRFYFHGFFPRKGGEQQQVLAAIRALDACLLFYESPNRLVATLAVLAEAFPKRRVCVCRELTKLHEEVVRGAAADVHARFDQRAREGAIKGEIVLVVDGPSAEEAADDAADATASAAERAAELVAGGMRNKDVSKTLVKEFGISRNEAYDLALAAAHTGESR